MTDPETCRHDIVADCRIDDAYVVLCCVSCATPINLEMQRELDKYYVFDAEYQVWVNTPKTRRN